MSLLLSYKTMDDVRRASLRRASTWIACERLPPGRRHCRCYQHAITLERDAIWREGRSGRRQTEARSKRRKRHPQNKGRHASSAITTFYERQSSQNNKKKLEHHPSNRSSVARQAAYLAPYLRVATQCSRRISKETLEITVQDDELAS